MFTPNEVVKKFNFLIKNHNDNLAVSYYKWIVKAIELEQEYYTICTTSGKNVYSHFQNWLPIEPNWNQMDMNNFFLTIYDVNHPIRFSIETFDSIEEIRLDGRWIV